MTLLHSLALLLTCQLAGEVLVRLAGLPVPGPVAGMLLLLAGLMVRRDLASSLRPVTSTLLQHLALLFVPAGVGVVSHLDRMRAEWLAIGSALVLSTLLTLVVTAATFRLAVRLTTRVRSQ